MVLKSERLKKLENDLADLEQWLKLGLVPKSDIDKHTSEIELFKVKIEDEKNRLRELKENGETEEFIAPKRGQTKASYQDTHSMTGIEVDGDTDAGYDSESESYEGETTASGSEISGEHSMSDDEEDPFSDKNRWKRGILEDPEADNW